MCWLRRGQCWTVSCGACVEGSAGGKIALPALSLEDGGHANEANRRGMAFEDPNNKGEDGAKEEKKEEEEVVLASVADMMLLAEPWDYQLVAMGMVGSVVNGLGDPLMMVFFADSLKALSDTSDALKTMERVAVMMVIVGGVLHVAASIQYACFSTFAKRQARKFREAWFRALLRQDIAYFDANDPAEMPGRIAEAIVKLQEGCGVKMGLGAQHLSGFLSGIIIAFFYNIYVALVVLSIMPVAAATGAMLVKVNTEAATFTEKAYARANAIAYETFAALRTVLSINAVPKVEAKYDAECETVRRVGQRRWLLVGFANGAMLASFVLMYLVMTFFGGWMLSHSIEKDGCDPSGAMDPRYGCNTFKLPRESDGSSLLVALICIAVGGQSLGQLATAIEAFTNARKAIKSAVDVMRRKPAIDSASDAGLKPVEAIKGRISFEDVSFCYPNRKDRQVCDGLCLEIHAGTTVALVGESGCGKSTLVQVSTLPSSSFPPFPSFPISSFPLHSLTRIITRHFFLFLSFSFLPLLLFPLLLFPILLFPLLLFPILSFPFPSFCSFFSGSTIRTAAR